MNVDVNPQVNVNVDVNPQTGVNVAVDTSQGVEVYVAPPPDPVVTTTGGAFAGLPPQSQNNVQVVLASNAVLEVIENIPGGESGADQDAGVGILNASIPLTDGLQNLIVNNTASGVTIRRTIGVSIVLPANFNQNVVRPAANMAVISRSLSGRSILGALGN